MADEGRRAAGVRPVMAASAGGSGRAKVGGRVAGVQRVAGERFPKREVTLRTGVGRCLPFLSDHQTISLASPGYQCCLCRLWLPILCRPNRRQAIFHRHHFRLFAANLSDDMFGSESFPTTVFAVCKIFQQRYSWSRQYQQQESRH